jgi:nucleoside 2-deoxyribosyltransferase
MRTVLIAGSKNLEDNAVEKRVLAARLGAMVISNPGWRLLTGGARGSGEGGIDFSAAQGAQAQLDESELVTERILTLHPREDREDLFEIGAVLVSRAKSTMARRFELVSRADAIILIEGHEGTLQLIEYAVASGTPVLPIPASGGASERAWGSEAYRLELMQSLGLREESPTFKALHSGVDDTELLSTTSEGIIRGTLNAACFVIMPFGQEHSDALWADVLVPVIREAGLTPIRADFVRNVGPIMEDVTNNIREAAIIVADITGTNPNVMYELGYAHALGKPAALLHCTEMDEDWSRNLPFDIRGMRILPVNPWRLEGFKEELCALLHSMQLKRPCK